jgi:hypothetical protein
MCNNGRGEIHHVREMMFGFRDVFEYFECSGSGCLQLIDPPADMRRYYPADSYYSFDSTPVPPSQEEPPSGRGPVGCARRWFAIRLRAAVLFESQGIFERLARLRHESWQTSVSGWASYLRYYTAESPRHSLRTRILDVGCGTGALLSSLARYGFERP